MKGFSKLTNSYYLILLVISGIVLVIGGVYLASTKYINSKADSLIKEVPATVKQSLIPIAHNVKYYYENIQEFSEKLPRSGITEEVVIQGKLIKANERVFCVIGPCPPMEMYGLEDINDPKFKIVFSDNKIVEKLNLTPGQIYKLNGVLYKGVNYGKKEVFITTFNPLTIVD